MKKTLAKIFGVAVVIALLASMLVAFVPASAAVTVSLVTPSSTNISNNPTTYNIRFAGSFNLQGLGTNNLLAPATARLPGDVIYMTGGATLTAAGGLTATLNGGAFVSPQVVAAGDVVVVTAAGTIASTTTNGVVNPDTVTTVFPYDTGLTGNAVTTATVLVAGDTIMVTGAGTIDTGAVAVSLNRQAGGFWCPCCCCGRYPGCNRWWFTHGTGRSYRSIH